MSLFLLQVVLTLSINISQIFSHPYLEVIQHYEGFHPEPYICPAGKRTIGYGHVLLEGERYRRISKWQGDLLLTKDAAVALWNLQDIAPELFEEDDPNKIVAVLSFIFNLGEGNFKNSTLLKRIHEKDWDAAADEFLRWNKATNPRTGEKEELAGLTKRRKSEALLFREGKIKVF